MRQFGVIFSHELRTYLKNKVFVGITLVLVLIMAVVMFFPRIREAFDSQPEPDISQGGEAEVPGEDEDLPVMYLGGVGGNEAVEIFSAGFPDYRIEPVEGSAQDLSRLVQEGLGECGFYLPSETEYIYYAQEVSLYDTNAQTAEALLKQVYQMKRMVEGGMTPETALEALQVQVSGEVVSLGSDQTQTFWYTYVMIFALYMAILLYGQMVATNVATEKSSRAMEVLITSAKPTSMMFGKVLASCVAGLLQLVVIFGAALVFYNLNSSYWGDSPMVAMLFDIPVSLLLYMVVFFVLGFLIYAFLFGAVGSTANKLEDINTSVMPISMLFVFAFIVVMSSMGSGNVDTILMQVLSYVPFTSPMAMFTRIAMSTVPWYQVALSVAILAASVVGVGILSAKIYRVGVLMYGKPPKITDLLKSLKNA